MYNRWSMFCIFVVNEHHIKKIS